MGKKQDDLFQQFIYKIGERSKLWIVQLFFFASLVASNINAFYTRFNNRNYMSLDGIINDSKEYYLKDDKEKNLLYYLIDETLKEKYHLKITDKDKLIVEKL